MGAVVHHRAVAPACLAAPHLNSVPAAGAAADAFLGALTTDDRWSPWLITPPDRLRRVATVATAPPHIGRALPLVGRWIEAKTVREWKEISKIPEQERPPAVVRLIVDDTFSEGVRDITELHLHGMPICESPVNGRIGTCLLYTSRCV